MLTSLLNLFTLKSTEFKFNYCTKKKDKKQNHSPTLIRLYHSIFENKKNIPDRSVITNFCNNAIIMTFFSIGIKTETGVKEVLDR